MSNPDVQHGRQPDTQPDIQTGGPLGFVPLYAGGDHTPTPEQPAEPAEPEGEGTGEQAAPVDTDEHAPASSANVSDGADLVGREVGTSDGADLADGEVTVSDGADLTPTPGDSADDVDSADATAEHDPADETTAQDGAQG